MSLRMWSSSSQSRRREYARSRQCRSNPKTLRRAVLRRGGRVSSLGQAECRLQWQCVAFHCGVYGAADMRRSAARFPAELCSTFTQSRWGVMGVCCRDPNQIRHAKELPTVRVAPNLQARCSAQHDATDLEFGHSELRNDFELWGIRLRLKHKG